MFLFPIIYIITFIYAIRLLLKKEIKGFLIFIILGLPIYINALSVAYLYGFKGAIPFLQAFKEIAVAGGFLMVVWDLKKKPTLHLVDKLMIGFFICLVVYLVLPIGSYNFANRFIGFKGLAIFPLIYFIGRLCRVESINLNHIFSYISLVSILAAGILVFFEVIPYQHLQTRTGYMDFYSHFFDANSSGSFGLTWTFETQTGLKRFASIFANPLEYAAATLISFSALAALVTGRNNKIYFSDFALLTILSTLVGIAFALSRASFMSYIILIYAYALIFEKKIITKTIHYALVLMVAVFLFVSLNGDLFEFIINTFNFTDSSSIGHVIEWLAGAEAIMLHPLGMGLGESGRVSSFSGLNTGGENQFIIIGVQVGIIALLIYLSIYISLIVVAIRKIKTSQGKVRKLAIFIAMIKIGLLIPLFTSEIESFIYVSYLTWFLSGLLINMVSIKKQVNEK